jgi:hypothetical protein
VGGDGGGHDAQAQPAAAGAVPGRVTPEEPLEDACALLLRYARAAVGDVDQHIVAGPAQPQPGSRAGRGVDPAYSSTRLRSGP